MLNWVNPKLTIEADSRGGRGQFVLDTVAAGELLIVYGGYVTTLQTYHSMSEELKQIFYQIEHDPILLYGPIDEREIGNGDYVNHSCNPNAGFASAIHLVAMNEIMAGEEVTFDYAMCMTNQFGDMECSCSSPMCRGLITGDDWMIESLQKRYESYFQPYIEKMIKMSRQSSHCHV